MSGGLNGWAGQQPVRNDIASLAAYFRNQELWFGISADQTGDDWAADRLVVFQAISGSAVYGADADDEAKVFGADDTPVVTGKTKFALRRILIDDSSVSTEYKLRVVWGTGTMAAAITAEQTTEVMVQSDATNPQLSAGVPIDVNMPLIDADTQVWVQCKNATDNATIDFYASLYET